MGLTKVDLQISALKELLMAKQAYHRAINEFRQTVPEKIRDDRLVYMLSNLPNIDPRDTSEFTLAAVLNLAYGISNQTEQPEGDSK